MDLKRITYHLHPDSRAPLPGEYMVSLNNKGIREVRLIKTVRVVKARVICDEVKYAIEYWPQPELKELTVVEEIDNSANVWVRGKAAWPCYSIPNKKRT